MIVQKETFEQSFRFFSGYLHRDFAAAFGGPEEAVQKFIEDTNVATQEIVVAELRQLLEIPGEAELEVAVLELGCHYSPQRDQNLELRIWLEQVAVTIERSSR